VYERALARLGAGHRSTIIAAALCSTANEALGKHASVVKEFGDADGLDAGEPPTDRAALRFAVGKSLWAEGHQERGVALARQALDGLDEDPKGRAEAEAWLLSIATPPE